MKKVIISVLLAFLTVTSVSAVSYRGFCELGPGLTRGGGESSVEYHISTTHGVQLNSHFFIGAGASYSYSEFGEKVFNYLGIESVGVYGTVRFDLGVIKKWSPYVSVDLGGKVFEDYDSGDDIDVSKFLFNLNFGVRIRMGRTTGLNLGFKYTPFKVNGSGYKYVSIPYEENGNIYYGGKEVPFSASASVCVIAFSVGFDF
ncbi:MAG: porin family protein [Paramuribaculum sp.]|nr:porin family protein [Paramuribaculum sp.]